MLNTIESLKTAITELETKIANEEAARATSAEIAKLHRQQLRQMKAAVEKLEKLEQIDEVVTKTELEATQS